MERWMQMVSTLFGALGLIQIVFGIGSLILNVHALYMGVFAIVFGVILFTSGMKLYGAIPAAVQSRATQQEPGTGTTVRYG